MDQQADPGCDRQPRRCRGFTLIEVLLVIMLLGLIGAMVVPNLGAFLPKAKLDAVAKTVVGNVDFLRSEARIRSERCSLELDLDKALWRRVFPPEQRLTTDQDIDSFEPKRDEWTEIEKGVRILAAGNPTQGLVKKGVFELAFDETGCCDDQVVVLQLTNDPTMVWTIEIRGLTGQCRVTPDFEGNQHLPEDVGEGSF